MNSKLLATIAICLMSVCVAVASFCLYAGFRWIWDNTFLWKNHYPKVEEIVGVSMAVATVVGLMLFFASLAWGTTRQRLISIIPGLVVFGFAWFILHGIIRYGF